MTGITQPWLGYSGNGSAVAPAVYGNYCEQSDYDYLATQVNISGMIVLCRYGQIFRAQKVQFAEERGAVGVLIYSDPADDGYGKGDMFPDGPARPPLGVQRGTLAYGQFCQGDPSEERRVGICGGVPKLYPKIPAQPISWTAAQSILQTMQGPPVASWLGWQGGLPFHYHIGPTSERVTLSLDVLYDRKPGYNVIARIPGTQSNSTVVIGCHHDAWVMGASDPLTGQAVMSELAKNLRSIYDAGWRPARNIIFAAWDGEEYNCLGSTAFCESGDSNLDSIVALLNIDGIVSTWFPRNNPMLSVDASPSMVDIFANALALTPSPVNASQPCAQHWDGSFGILGDGSDYSNFLDRLGVPVINLGWGNAGVGSIQYHSVYDSFYTIDTFSDPDFLVHKSSTILCAEIMYSLSTFDLNMNFTNLSVQLAEYKLMIVNQYPSLASLDWSAFDDASAEIADSAVAIQ